MSQYYNFTFFPTRARMCPVHARHDNPSRDILANEMFHNLPSTPIKMCLIRLWCPAASCASIWLPKKKKKTNEWHHIMSCVFASSSAGEIPKQPHTQTRNSDGLARGGVFTWPCSLHLYAATFRLQPATFLTEPKCFLSGNLLKQ